MRALFGMAALVVLTACSSSDPSTAGGGDSGAAAPGSDGGQSSGPPVSLGMPQTGDGTYYNATGAGNCSFDAIPSDLDVAAWTSAPSASPETSISARRPS